MIKIRAKWGATNDGKVVRIERIGQIARGNFGMAMEYGCYGPDDVQLGIAPMSHGAGFAFIMATLYFGGTVEVLPRFEPELVLSRLGSRPFTGVFMVPTHFNAIFGLEQAALGSWRGR